MNVNAFALFVVSKDAHLIGQFGVGFYSALSRGDQFENPIRFVNRLSMLLTHIS